MGNTSIQWTNRALGARKMAAKKMGISIDEYNAHVDAGEKRCYKCKLWKAVSSFASDSSRGDGLKARCHECDYVRLRNTPNKEERQQKSLLGLAYCRHCTDWLPANEVRKGICRLHINEDARQRYKNDTRYRGERRQHAHARKRNVNPLPVVGQIGLLSYFHGQCAYCSNQATTWDHIVPISKGGRTSPDNVVPACASCNSSKGDRDVMTWVRETGRELHLQFFEIIDLAWSGLFCAEKF